MALLVVLLALLGGGGYLAYRTVLAAPSPNDTAAGPGDPGGRGAEDAGPLPGLPTTPVEACPFTVEQMSAMLGRPMTGSGPCVFGDGPGGGQVAIRVDSVAATRAEYPAARSRAEARHPTVQEVESGDEGFVALGDTDAEAVVIAPRAGYTITMRGFTGLGGDGTYEQPMRNVIGALPR